MIQLPQDDFDALIRERDEAVRERDELREALLAYDIQHTDDCLLSEHPNDRTAPACTCGADKLVAALHPETTETGS